MCFYKALKVYPSQKDLMDVYEKLVPTPALDILKEMIALTNAAAIEQIPTKIGEEAYFRKVGEKEACFLQKRTHFMQEVSRGCALCKDQDRDGPLIQILPNDKMLINSQKQLGAKQQCASTGR